MKAIRAVSFYRKILGLALLPILLMPNFAFAGVVPANPSTYRTLLAGLEPGDTLQLASGIYEQGLPISNLHGNPGQPIIISGPENGDPAIFYGSRNTAWNTVQIDNSSYVTVRHMTLDGLEVPYVDAVNSRGITHHITLEYLRITNHAGAYVPDTDHQLTVGIATRGPAWDWVIRNNVIIGAGTGIYLGNSTGRDWPFVGGLVEHNVILDTLGYNIQIKHMQSRRYNNGNSILGMPTEDRKTIIRHNVFGKANKASIGGTWARPNLLVGHWPLTGDGSNDLYEIYGNFFYQNPNEALFQGEGNITLYDNLFVNNSDSGVHIQPHNDKPRMIRVFHNTLVTSGTGIRVSGIDIGYDQLVSGNAVFSTTPFSLNAQVQRSSNVSDIYDAANAYLNEPFGDPTLGNLSLYPKTGTLSGSSIDTSVLQLFTDWDLDFNGDQRVQGFRGAYAKAGVNSGWQLALTIKPDASAVSNGAPSIIDELVDLTVNEGEAASFNIKASGLRPLSYQWFRDGSVIADATENSYILPRTSPLDNAVYSCEVSNALGSIRCNGTVLTVSPDVIPATVVSAFTVSNTRVNIVFSEPVELESAESIANYQIDLGIAVISTSLSDDGYTVSLSVSPLSADIPYTVLISNVNDRALIPNATDQSSASFIYRTTDGFEDGIAAGWIPLTPARWSVVMDEGDMAYYLNTSDFNNLEVGRLGEYSLLSTDFGDFTFTAQAKLGDDVTKNSLADYAVVFGFQDENNYYYAMFNNTQSATQLFKVVNGSRVELVTSEGDWLSDNLYHSVEVSRIGSEIKVSVDGNLMSTNDSTFGAGQVGVGSYNDAAYFDDVSVKGVVFDMPDNTAPVITLTGDNPQAITLGSVYSKFGATAMDNKDGDISDNITMDASAVNTAIAGSYNVTYNVSDAAGNAAVEVIRTVNVMAVVSGDDMAPVITLLGSNPITITERSTYTDPGATAIDNIDGNLTTSIQTVNPVDTTNPGIYNVTYDVSDAKGNAATQVTRTVNVTAAATDNPDDSDGGTGAFGPLLGFGLILLAVRRRLTPVSHS